ncbi:hypothetical protein ACMFMG_000127 [Clarireedia jacksonii]
MNWKPLKLSASAAERVPPFLIASDFATDAYAIYLTDFTNTWCEKLDKDEILRRGREEDASIDPSEDEDQLRIFLDKIRFGLEGGKDTELRLGVGSAGRVAPELSLNRQGETAEKLVIPTIQLLHETKKRSDKLIEMLEEKDAVIQKLVDSLERLGTDLGAVFHQAAGRPGRKVDRKKASERVKGLGPFDVGVWRTGLKPNEALDVPELLDSVFGEVNTIRLPRTDFHKLQRGEDWWKGMDGEMIQLFGDENTTAPKTPPRPAQRDSIPAEDDEDGFQIQATPPHLSKNKQTFSMDDSTEDEYEDDLDAPSQRTQIPDSFPISQHRAPSPPKVPPKKLGNLGTKRKAPTPTPSLPAQEADDTVTEDDEPIPSPLPKNTNSVIYNDNDNDTTEDEEDDTPPLPPPKRQKTPQKSPTPPLPPTKKKSKLGQIRSKKAATPPPPSPSSPRSPSLSPSPPPPPSSQPPASQTQTQTQYQRPRGKLGKIGGRKKETTPEADVLPEQIATPTKKRIGGIGRAKGGTSVLEESGEEGKVEEEETQREKTPPLPPKVETEEEKADRKREELKKELEAKAKAKAPVKKKRKF